LLYSNPTNIAKELKDEASTVIKQVAAEDANLKIVDNSEINESRIGHLKNIDYDQLKRLLRVDSDFCIYIEDENGNIMLINDSYKGVGGPIIEISGTPCSQK